MSVVRRDGTPRQSPGRALLLVAAGVALATGAGAAACRSQPAEDFGAPVVTASASAPTARVPIADGTIPAADGTAAPTRLRIPALDLDAVVDAVGIEPATGDFAVPPSVDRVGWYRYGPGFAAGAGSIVIAGHVDSAAEGDGAFFKLGSLDAGDTVTLTGPGGKAREFEVVARKRYQKTAIPLQEYFARDGAVRLTLITCGGPFDPETRHYRDNVVVTAALRR
ncbi:class F sortase [Actinoplanes italicus]|uniref:Sortase family protein n=1 Tax=Actinoplanes italicus TaxID=113567 RepID=A0A2T0JVJ3_9ACTN|nr:class F sortase [Actinoplanes italicus]PRX11470.1 sortase family protein [Actinoplanes italicus]GIE34001.1 class F sortase [Actinoplanes italicus]